MQVILRTDIESLGRLGDVVNVKPGYARNYLVPKKLALEATPGNLKAFEQQRRKLEKRLEKARYEAKDLADKIESVELVIPVRVGEGDKLYGSVTNTHIAEALAAKGIHIDKKKVELESPIRSLGEYTVPVRVYPEVRPEVKVSVVRHGEEQQQEGEQHA
jgi:large subunit ribosomal protein L9